MGSTMAEHIEHVLQLRQFLRDDAKSSIVFHRLFKKTSQEKLPSQEKQKKKKSQKDGKDKSKDKTDSEEQLELYPPKIEIQNNASSFSVYTAIRQAILERETLTRKYIQGKVGDVEQDGEEDGGKIENVFMLPKVVGFGLRSVFELIRETRNTHPSFCTRALKALLDMLQGLAPEELAGEPSDITDPLFDLLLDLTTNHRGEGENADDLQSLSAACLISLIIARGETGKILAGLSALLMHGHRSPFHTVEVPSNVVALQNSISAILVGKTVFPDWPKMGVPEEALLLSFPVQIKTTDPGAGADHKCAIASNGSFLYIHSNVGLFKVGSGYGNTLQGHIYAANPSFYPDYKGWLVIVRGRLYFYPQTLRTEGAAAPSWYTQLLWVDLDTLQEKGHIEVEDVSPDEQLFSDGVNLGHLYTATSEEFTALFSKVGSNALIEVGRMSSELTKKRMVMSDNLTPGMTKEEKENSPGVANPLLDGEVKYIGVGKEFTLCRDVSGKLYFIGKGQALGMKETSSNKSNHAWSELTRGKSLLFEDCCVWHEGLPAVFLGNDGTTYLCLGGHASQQEQGEQGRRVIKASKPIKLQGMEGKTPIRCACNNGTTGVVTKEGDLYLFGKLYPNKEDADPDQSPGLVTSLKGTKMEKVALGKSHGCAISSEGDVFTFGVNNKGQCGRGGPGNDAEKDGEKVDMSVIDIEDDFEDEEKEKGEDPCDHDWIQSECMVCTQCGECTGYGAQCINSTMPNRKPGMLCGCGAGDAGCTKCRICKSCAGEPHAMRGNLGGVRLNQVALYKMGWLRPDDRGKGDDNNLSGDELKEVEKAVSKPTILPPEEIMIHPDTKVRAVEASCGFHHTVILLDNGEVYTFGSNSYGQLGQGDTTNRLSAVKVKVPEKIKQVSAGSYHTLLLTECGKVYSFGRCQKGQLCRPVFEGTNNAEAMSHTTPAEVADVGPEKGNKAVWIGASGDRTFIKVDEALISMHMLESAIIFASKTAIGILPQGEDCRQRCMIIDRNLDTCESFSDPNQVKFDGCGVCSDPVYNSLLWSFDPRQNTIQCYSSLKAAAGSRLALSDNLSILGPELSLPSQPQVQVSSYQVALNILGCLDVLSMSLEKGLTVEDTVSRKEQMAPDSKVEDFSFVNRFEGYGGGWGYSGHSVEAVIFSVDTDIQLGGFGLFGGRGEYTAKIKLYQLETMRAHLDSEGELKAESEEKTYECGTKEEFPILFDEPVSITSGVMYLAWAKVNGPSSDCGSGGQAIVTTEDKVTFHFLSSRKSNNGTDVSAGQIPKLYYRLPSPEQDSITKPKGKDFPLHVLTSAFCWTVSPEAFESLLLLLQWAWTSFTKRMEQSLKVDEEEIQPIIKDLTSLSYICTSCLRLAKSFVCDVFPNPASSRKSKSGRTNQLPQCISSTCKLLRKILQGRPEAAAREEQVSASLMQLEMDIVEECQRTFIYCFHAFCPTSQLKWVFFCELLGQQDKEQGVNGSQTLLTAVLGALCDPSIKLTRVLPLLKVQEPDPYPFLKEKGNTDKSNLDDNSPMGVDMDRGNLLADLISHIESNMKGEQQVAMNTSFQEILDQLLHILSVPIRSALEEKNALPVHSIQTNTSNFLVCVIGELASLATNCEAPYHSPTKPLLTTPSRYTRTNQSYNWSTCNGTPDAVCFSVNQTGIQIAGICVYTGLGQYNYELELLDGVEGAGDAHGPRWNSLEFARGVFGGEDAVDKLVEVKFDKPVSVKEGVKYAIRLRLHGGKTFSGEGGSSQMRCPDGVTFTFSNCTLSSNGTSLARGQIPQVLYYNHQSVENKNSLPEGSKSMEMEQQARNSLFTVTQAVIRQAMDVLARALCFEESVVPHILRSSPLFSHLLPLTLAYIGPVAATHPKSSVQTLNFIRDILPQVATLNTMFVPQTTVPSHPTDSPVLQLKDGSEVTRSQRYVVVESDHPYQPATVCHFKVSFPSSVKWMTLEFGSECGTSQPEDSLQLYIGACQSTDTQQSTASVTIESEVPARYWPVMSKFHGRTNWPSSAVVLPGHEVIFSLCTASDYVKDKKANRFGFKCHVFGFEQNSLSELGLVQLEKELCYLGGLCSAALLKKDIPLSSFLAEGEDDIEPIAEAAQEVFTAHAALLGKGFSLSQPLTIQQALKGNLPLQTQSNEKTFLQDFVQNVSDTSGGRLAGWFQPDSYIDPKRCEVVLPKQGLSCSIPSQLMIHTRDQYGSLVYVSSLKVEVEAVPSARNESSFSSPSAAKSDSSSQDTTFGGLPVPKMETSYQPTLRRESSLYISITMMKDYEQYSFEELRLAYMPSSRPTETVLVRDNQDGTFSANWTPGSIGVYSLQVKIDGYLLDGLPPIEVSEPPYGIIPSSVTPKKQEIKAKMRKFVAKHSSGLRIRTSPSLKSEQIGIVKVDGVVAFTEELQNGDGVWVRLTFESIKKFCPDNGHHKEGWCLQYNQHIGKTLLVPIEDPKPLFKDPQPPEQDEAVADKEPVESKVGGPGMYHVINCGPSGHNIRCKASLKASAIGMMVSGNILKVIADRKGNDGGLWVQLDKESIAQYCEGKHAEAWALAASKGQVYLSLKEVDPKEKVEEEDSLAGSGQRRSSSGPGFDFKNTQGPPQLEFASNGEIPAFGDGKEVFSVDEGGHAEKQNAGVNQRQARISQSEEIATPSTSDDSSQSTPSKNGAKHTSPQKMVSKGQFTIGSGEGSPKSGLSPKLSRRPRVGSRRSRSSSPAGKEHSPSRTKITPPKQDGKEKFKPAFATSVCECARAVFAAFLWHEGLVHDAMACASFLKFNPGLTKAVAYDSGEENIQGSKREHKLKNRHSMDLSKAMKERDFPVDIIALNINENGAVLRKRMESGSSIGPKEEELPEDEEWRDRASSVGGAVAADQDVKKPIAHKAPPITVPITLKNLLTLWDDISEATVNIASQSLVLPSPAPIIKTASFKTVEMKEIPRPREPKGKKRRDRPAKGGRGNLFGDAAGAPIGGEKHESVCELCFGVFPRPVTFHMKNAHPGCGRTAQGYGYNSSGTYCGGWAGNCGDGGMAGSSWYLMCLRCRSKYTHDRQDKMKDKEKIKKMKKKLPPLKTPKVIPPLEAHHVMKANALFLLDLASASGPSFSPKCQSVKMQRRFDMPAVKEADTLSPENPFPVIQFQFLKNSPMSPEEIDFGEMVQHVDYDGIPAPSRSVPALNLSVSNNEDTLKANGHRKGSYLRSVSMLVQDGQREMKMRRRNHSGSADDGSSLLRRPSPRLASLMEESMTGILPLNRPSMRFMVRHHDLEGLKLAMKQSLCKAACKIHSLQGLNWLLRSVTQPVCIHDLLWHFVGALSPVITEKETEEEEKGKDAKNGKDAKEEVKEVAAEPEKDQEGLILEHPLEDILVMEEAVSLLPVAFHDFLQTVSNLMLVLPHGGALQKMALQCWSMKFRTTDHMFLHQSHVFSNINRILSKSDEVEAEDNSVEERREQPFAQLEYLADITNSIECEVSSRSVMLGCLTDGSTETFWESGDEDRNKPKVITVKVKDSSTPAMIAVHIDNSRDLRNKVNLVTLSAGAHSSSLQKVKQTNLDLRFVGWVTFDLEEFSESRKVMTIDVKGPDSHLRVRQIKVLGVREGDHMPELLESDLSLQPMDCISESLRIFRLLTSQVFGRLLAGEFPTPDGKITPEGKPLEEDGDAGDPDLREHMVGILFSRSRLTSLQKQVCSHIVLAIHKEASRMQEYWEGSITDGDNLSQVQNGRVDVVALSDAYCFELLSMVLALSYSGVGRAYVAQQTELLQDLLSLLHTSTPRVQRQVTSILRKVLPEISPSYFARVVGVTNLPSSDIVMLSQEGHSSSSSSGSPQKGVLDVFLACIAKALTVQVKAKGIGGSKAPQSTSVAKTFASPKQGGGEQDSTTEESQVASTDVSQDHWYLRGTMSSNLAEQIISLIKDMSKGEISSAWTDIAKSAVAEVVLSLTRIPEDVREPIKCLQESTLWLSLASLCVLEPEHVDRLSTSQRAQNVEKTPNKEKPTCENHDDGMTMAIIECNACGTLCADCDRILHLPKTKRHHQRKVFKEEEDSIKVDLHEGCGRSKLYWITALADSKTLKAMVEFKQTSAESVGVSGSHGVCRFCGNVAAVGLGRAGNVCSDAECKKYSSNICSKRLSCGHLCGGIRDESPCLPCLHGCSKDPTLKQDAEDMCMICFTEALSCAPAIQLDCGHVFHQHCCKAVLEKRWVGPRITFGFTLCPICKASINHKSLKDDLDPIQALEADVRRKALMRLEYEGLDKCEAVTTPGARYHNNPAGFAMNRYAYYVCFKCQKAYYGGEARCDQDAAAAGSGDYNPAELICGGCSDVARAQLCPKHGTDYLEYKCRYCCSVAVYFCFGSTHFCNPCHDNFQWITSMSKSELPHCPAGPGAIQLEGDECPLHVEHPATGEEFALGCGICRNTHTF